MFERSHWRRHRPQEQTAKGTSTWCSLLSASSQRLGTPILCLPRFHEQGCPRWKNKSPTRQRFCAITGCASSPSVTITATSYSSVRKSEFRLVEHIRSTYHFPRPSGYNRACRIPTKAGSDMIPTNGNSGNGNNGSSVPKPRADWLAQRKQANTDGNFSQMHYARQGAITEQPG